MEEHSSVQSSNTKLIKKRDASDRLKAKVAFECTILFKGRAEEGRKYMEKELGKTIAESTYYQYLRELDDEPELHAWLEDQARIGFVKNQRDMVEEILYLKGKATKSLEEEMAKEDTIEITNKLGTITIPNPNKSKFYIISLMRMINDYNKRLGELNLGNPIIATIKYMLDHAGQTKQVRREPLRAII